MTSSLPSRRTPWSSRSMAACRVVWSTACATARGAFARSSRGARTAIIRVLRTRTAVCRSKIFFFERSFAPRVRSCILSSSLSLSRPTFESPDEAATVDAQVELVLRLRRGEPAAVAEAYDEHQAALRAFARKLCGDTVVAEDLVHDVFVALPSAVKRFREDAALRTFLISIAVNHAKKHVRAAARRRAAMERYAQEPPLDGPTPEREVARRQLAAALSRALDRLSLDHRVAFVLCEVEQRTSREAAEVVGAPEETVRTRLFHAKKKLRASLEKEGIR